MFFNQHFVTFRYLTNEGIEFLRTYLHLPAEIVPATLKKQTRPELTRARPAGGPRSEGGRPGEDSRAYRRTPMAPSQDKKADVGPGTADLEFVSQFINFFHNICYVLMY